MHWVQAFLLSFKSLVTVLSISIWCLAPLVLFLIHFCASLIYWVLTHIIHYEAWEELPCCTEVGYWLNVRWNCPFWEFIMIRTVQTWVNQSWWVPLISNWAAGLFVPLHVHGMWIVFLTRRYVSCQGLVQSKSSLLIPFLGWMPPRWSLVLVMGDCRPCETACVIHMEWRVIGLDCTRIKAVSWVTLVFLPGLTHLRATETSLCLVFGLICCLLR